MNGVGHISTPTQPSSSEIVRPSASRHRPRGSVRRVSEWVERSVVTTSSASRTRHDSSQARRWVSRNGRRRSSHARTTLSATAQPEADVPIPNLRHPSILASSRWFGAIQPPLRPRSFNREARFQRDAAARKREEHPVFPMRPGWRLSRIAQRSRNVDTDSTDS